MRQPLETLFPIFKQTTLADLHDRCLFFPRCSRFVLCSSVGRPFRSWIHSLKGPPGAVPLQGFQCWSWEVPSIPTFFPWLHFHMSPISVLNRPCFPSPKTGKPKKMTWQPDTVPRCWANFVAVPTWPARSGPSPHLTHFFSTRNSAAEHNGNQKPDR